MWVCQVWSNHRALIVIQNLDLFHFHWNVLQVQRQRLKGSEDLLSVSSRVNLIVGGLLFTLIISGRENWCSLTHHHGFISPSVVMLILLAASLEQIWWCFVLKTEDVASSEVSVKTGLHVWGEIHSVPTDWVQVRIQGSSPSRCLLLDPLTHDWQQLTEGEVTDLCITSTRRNTLLVPRELSQALFIWFLT